MARHLQPGDPAPGFRLPDQRDAPVDLADYRGRKVMVFFYPKANTSGCTAQACGLRDVAPQVGSTAIVGVSPDPPGAQARFDAAHGLGFPLLSDPDHAVAEAWGVWGEKSLYGRRYLGVIRSAFLVDEAGVLEQVWYGVSPKNTAANLLRAVGGEGPGGGRQRR